jgi:AAHS family 4-hydroxybenzoate transporter-like MFS transporter
LPGVQSLIDIGEFMDKRRLGATHVRVFLLCALVAMLDGADSQSIGVAMSKLGGQINIAKANFGPILSAGQFGAMIGALTSGLLADALGRRPLLIFNAILFGVFTLATPLAGNFTELFCFRALAGLGLGGATPCFLALMSDYAPRDKRATLVSLLWAGFPVGATLGGFLNAYLISHFDWTMIFWLGGTAPLVIDAILLFALPESPQFLVTRGAAADRVRQALERLAPGEIAADTQFILREEKLPGVPVRHLFTGGRALYTLLLWAVFATAFGTLTVFVLWTPTLLAAESLTLAAGAAIVALSNLGAVIGQASAGWLVKRFGPARTLAPALVIGAVFFACVGLPGLPMGLRGLCAVGVGVFVGLGSSGAIALAAMAYPAAIRSTGIGWGMGMGRGGQVLTPLAAGAVLAAGMGASNVFLIMAGIPAAGAIFVLLLALRKLRVIVPANVEK